MSIKKKFLLFASFLFILFSWNGYGQVPDTVREKVHLHLDKPFYAAGDTLWFKAYVVIAGSNRLSALSKVLHIEFINRQDSVIRSLLLPLTEGLARGD
ncbi:hypothetical protein, partial [Mucilaginibacter segetis]